MTVSLLPHQRRALDNLKNGSILVGDVGSGKSITALAYYYIRVGGGVPAMPGVKFQPMRKPRDLYIITTAKKRNSLEWESDAAMLGLGSKENPDGVTTTVDSWNNIHKYADVKDAFFIFDEQRVVGSGAWTKSFLKITANNPWILLSATPGDVWMDYIPAFVANGFYRNRSEFIKRHVVYSRFSKYPKVERFIETARLHQLRERILVDMPFERHTTRNEHHLMLAFNKELEDRVIKNRWHIYEDRPIKDAAELYAVLRKITNSDPSRAGELMRLLEGHPKIIVFYSFNYELEMLRNLAATLNYPMSEWNGQNHDEIPSTDKWLYLVQYTAGAEGWNCIETDTICFYDLTYSWRAFEQAKGRIDRMNTPFHQLHYYIFRSGSRTDRAIWRALMSKKNFNARKFTEQFWPKE